jgi:hypothetical protein
MTTESPPLVGTSAPYVSRPINKKEGIINKVFVDMLDNLGYDIQLVYVKKKGAAEKLAKKDSVHLRMRYWRSS